MPRYEVKIKVDIPGIVSRNVIVTVDAPNLADAIESALKQCTTTTAVIARIAADDAQLGIT